MQSKSRGSAQAPPPAGPAPPPMPIGDLFADVNKGTVDAESAAQKSRAELFAQLNLGADVTKGLKKVTADMQTHKNPSLRASDVVRAPTSATGNTSSLPRLNQMISKSVRVEISSSEI